MTRALPLLLLLGALAACGRPGPVRPPGPPEAIIYPRLYPYDPSTRAPPASVSPVPAPATAR